MKLTIKGRPIAKKNSKRIFVRQGKPIVLPSKAYENFKELAGWQIKSQWKREPIKERVYISMTFELKGKFDPDGDNLVSSIFDILENFGVIENDKLVDEHHAIKKHGYKDWATHIKIVPLVP